MLKHIESLRKQGIEPTEDDVLTNLARPEGKVVTRDEAGRAVGLRPRTFQTGKKVLKEIDRLREEGKEKLAAKVEKKAETSINGALKMIEHGEEPKPAEPHDILYWYVPMLKRAAQNLNGYALRIKRKTNNTTPAAFSFFLENMIAMSKRLDTWLPENMGDCPICHGTGAVPGGSACTNCYNGKTGQYVVPAPEITEEPKVTLNYSPLYCAQCGDKVGQVEVTNGNALDVMDDEVVFDDDLGYLCGPCARGLEGVKEL
jgi:hypothetical protein